MEEGAEMYDGYKAALELLCDNGRVSIQGGTKEQRLAPNVRNVIELRDNAVPVVWPGEAILFVHLRGEMTEDDNGRRVGPQKD
jgi:hypothetical protein